MYDTAMHDTARHGTAMFDIARHGTARYGHRYMIYSSVIKKVLYT